MSEKRKIIEIYVNEEDDETTFEFEKVENSDVANETLRGLLKIFIFNNEDINDLEVELEEESE